MTSRTIWNAPTKKAKTIFFPENSFRLLGFQVSIWQSEIWCFVSDFNFA